MDPLLPADTEVMEREEDKDAKRKIQFSVPSSVPTQLDPRQVEMIRRRRPTPATLFRLTDPPSPDEDSGPHQWVLGENGALKAKLVHASTYQPPSLKGKLCVRWVCECVHACDRNVECGKEREREREREREKKKTDGHRERLCEGNHVFGQPRKPELNSNQPRTLHQKHENCGVFSCNYMCLFVFYISSTGFEISTCFPDNCSTGQVFHRTPSTCEASDSE
uniref:Protein phosphatase 1 regulatory subunit 1B n=1 Tax=Seriola dumerili TaxID=41447 RepID=A0A3B4VEN0_SERDU